MVTCPHQRRISILYPKRESIKDKSQPTVEGRCEFKSTYSPMVIFRYLLCPESPPGHRAPATWLPHQRSQLWTLGSAPYTRLAETQGPHSQLNEELWQAQDIFMRTRRNLLRRASLLALRTQATYQQLINYRAPLPSRALTYHSNRYEQSD